MNMKKCSRFILTAIIAFCSSTIGIAQSAEEELPPIDWPASSRPKIDAKLLEINEDGAVEDRIAFKCPQFDMLMVYNGDLKVVKNSSRHSILLKSESSHGVHFGISLFGKNEFLSDLEDETWNRYLESLKITKPNAEIVFQSDRPTDRVGPNLFNKRVRQIAYEIPTKEGEPLKKREMFFFLEDNLFVFTYSGPKSDIDRLWRRHNQLVSQMNLVAKPKKVASL